MTLINLAKAPFIYFGGKAHAAPLVWSALGDVSHFVEPFAGSCAVLLRRPHLANRPYHSETVCDRDGLLINALRSIAYSPQETAEAASWYVAEADLTARQLAILKWKKERNLELLMADPYYHDPVIGGFWIWGISCWIGSGWCSGDGPWVVGADGRITKRPGSGGVNKKRPHLGNDGRGVNHAGAREPGVARKLPHLGNNGQGVNHAGAREPGVADCDMEFHPMTMPEVRRWFEFLSARLRHVRIVNGDWRRVVTTGAAWTLPVRQGDGVAGYFIDPPYAASAGRASDLYTEDDLNVAHAAREWALEAGKHPRNRIVFAGFAGEHGDAFAQAGWREIEWFKAGWLRGGMGNQNDDGHQQDRERLWLSPFCLAADDYSGLPMFADYEEGQNL